MDTIYATATARGRAGIAVIRISGPSALAIAESVAGPLPASNTVAVRILRNRNGDPLDEAVVLPFHGPKSFTGEDVVEFHIHGSLAVEQAVLSRLSAFDEARHADPGEFTRRALENGRLDLTQVEGLSDLICAETEAQRKQAQRTVSGALREKVDAWRTSLIRAAALIEATIDFADEEVPEDVTPEVISLLESVLSDVSAQSDGSRMAERIRDGFEVAILGPPNAGKSTLLNALAGREAAIISEVAGTTRDVIEVRMDLGGMPVTILDTAGLRSDPETIEAIGIQRAQERAESADLRIFLTDDPDELRVTRDIDDIVLRPKADLRSDDREGISGLTGQGVPELIEKLRKIFAERVSQAGLATHARHRRALDGAAGRLLAALELLSGGPASYDLCAEEIRRGITSLEVLIGRVGVENLLDEIFANFCVGK